MDNMWGNFDTSEEMKIPKKILEDQALYISKMTNNKLYGEVIERDTILFDFEEDDDDIFIYELVIKSDFIRNYKFEVLSIQNKILQYPLEITVPNEIMVELLTKNTDKYISENFENTFNANNEEEFLSLLGLILGSDNLTKIIKTLYQMTK